MYIKSMVVATALIVGYPIHEEVVIEAPWGDQTKPAGQDAFLAFDSGKNQFYMINVDSQGLPIGYIKAP